MPAETFLVHFNTYDEEEANKPKKKKYGHFPNDWMLGESCWPAFRDRVQAQYNFSVYTCHQTTIDGLHRGKFEQCTAEVEKLCVRPFCTPKLTVVSYPSTASTAKPVAISRADTHPVPHPTFDAPPSADGGAGGTGNGNGVGSPVSYPGPRLVMLGCDGCGIPELWRTLVAARPPGGRLQVALTNPGDHPKR